MKKLILLFAASATIMVSCSKKNSSNPGPDNKPPVTETPDTLLTLNLSNDNFDIYSSTYFVLTDETGEIINEVKYTSGTKDLKIISPKPYKKDRLNFFLVNISADTSRSKSNIRGFLQIRKGSHYDANNFTLLNKPHHELECHVKNPSYFNKLGLIGDYYGSFLDWSTYANFPWFSDVSDDSKLLVLLETNGQHFYNFLTIPEGASSIDVDMTQVNKPSLVKNITSSGTNLTVQIAGRSDKKYFNYYNFGLVTSSTNNLNYYYPQVVFDEYITEIGYNVGKLNYLITQNTNTIPDKADTYDAVINTPASNLTTFKPSFSGNVDYYQARFANTSSADLSSIVLYAPAAANYNNIKFPDFSKYLGVKNVDLTKQVLTYFCIYQDSTFNEKNIMYKFRGSFDYSNLYLKSVSQDY